MKKSTQPETAIDLTGSGHFAAKVRHAATGRWQVLGCFATEEHAQEAIDGYLAEPHA